MHGIRKGFFVCVFATLFALTAVSCAQAAPSADITQNADSSLGDAPEFGTIVPPDDKQEEKSVSSVIIDRPIELLFQGAIRQAEFSYKEGMYKVIFVEGWRGIAITDMMPKDGMVDSASFVFFDGTAFVIDNVILSTHFNATGSSTGASIEYWREINGRLSVAHQKDSSDALFFYNLAQSVLAQLYPMVHPNTSGIY